MNNDFEEPIPEVFNAANVNSFENRAKEFVDTQLRPIFGLIRNGNSDARENFLDIYGPIVNFSFNINFHRLPAEIRNYITKARTIANEVISDRRTLRVRHASYISGHAPRIGS